VLQFEYRLAIALAFETECLGIRNQIRDFPGQWVSGKFRSNLQITNSHPSFVSNTIFNTKISKLKVIWIFLLKPSQIAYKSCLTVIILDRSNQAAVGGLAVE
jgi:hypothetical protein